MKLEGIHHITCITADAQSNVDFYAGVMGLRLVKKTVNQDDPTVYHLFFADEKGDAGSDLTFFEFPGVPKGRAGAGEVNRIVWRVASEEALDFWVKRLADNGITAERGASSPTISFADPEGLVHELLVVDVPDPPLIADHPEVPAELALQGFHAVRAYSTAPDADRALFEALEFEPTEEGGGGWKRAALSAAASSSTTSRRPSGRCRAPGPSTTSPGHRRSTSTRSGGKGRSRAGLTRRR